jgi:hypothetical protein
MDATPIMDRNRDTLVHMQLSFINAIAIPVFELLATVIPNLHVSVYTCLYWLEIAVFNVIVQIPIDTLRLNKEKWKDMAAAESA